MKKISILLFTLFLGLILVACGPGEDPGPDPGVDPDPDIPIDFTDYESLFEGDWNRPGLYNKDGSEHQMPQEVVKTGLTVDVTFYGAKANDPNFDNYTAFKEAIDSAEAGDEVYIPEGTFYFKGSRTFNGYPSHIILKSDIILRGAGRDKTVLVSMFSEYANEMSQTTVITVVNSKNILIEDLAITSPVLDENLPDENSSNLQSGLFGGPKNGITIDTVGTVTELDRQSHNIVIRNVMIEKFQRMAIRLRQSREVTIDGILVQKALNLGGGGAGYGISIQGSGWNVDWTGTTKDTVWNVVKNSEFKGPHLRHGALIQYHAHNNLIDNNTFTDILLDAVDLHGEDEYSNEISNNTILNTRRGAGVGVGNSGATHDAAGRNNFIHNNLIEGGLRGIDVILGSPRTIIKDNIIKDLTEDKSIGITLSNAPYTFIIQNTFENISGRTDGYAIKGTYFFDPLDPEAGIPNNLSIVGNTFDTVRRGVYLETHGDEFNFEENEFNNITEYEFKTDKESFVLPERSTLMDPVVGFEILPTDANFITTEARGNNAQVQSQKNMKFKASRLEPQFNRMIYTKFDITERTNITYERVYLSFTAKAQEGKPTINIWGNTTYVDWNMNTLVWDEALLHDMDLAIIKQTEEHPLTKVYDFTFPVAVYDFNTYYIDITDYIEGLNTNVFTLVLSNDEVEEVYMEVYNHQQVASNQHFRLIFK